MFCPKCRSEFEAGYTRCAECDTDLVESLSSDEEESTELVTVYEGDAEAAAVVRAKLESAGIGAWIQGEGAQGLFPNLSPVAVQVRAEDAAAADTALGDVMALDENTVVDELENPSDES